MIGVDQRIRSNRDGRLSDFFQELLASVFDASSFGISQLRQLGYVSSSLELPLVQLDNYIASDNMLDGAKWRPYLAAQSRLIAKRTAH